MNYVIWFLLISACLFVLFKVKGLFKLPKVGAMCLVNGGVKCGKSTLSVALVRREYRVRRRKVKIKNFFARIFHKKQRELPLIYSNVPLACPYVPLTDDLLLRKKRFVYGSVVYVQEASLVADSQLIRDMDINERLCLFNKLIGHETRGGVLIYDTQAVSDLHYSIKRCLSEYFYIHHLIKWIPFVLVAYVQECRYSDDGSALTVSTTDVEDTLKRVFISKKNWKYFDCYCYSVLTDDLPVENHEIKNNIKTKDLKAYEVLSFRQNSKYKIKKEKKNEEKID